jgi:hypothetical protein
MHFAMQTYLFYEEIKTSTMPESKSSIAGKYFALIGEGENKIAIPIVISNTEEDLYRACSVLHGFESSLTFERGVTPQIEYHGGAEKTVRGYLQLGTHVAYVPEVMETTQPFANPPWVARMFIHYAGESKDGAKYIPQPVYGIDPTIEDLLWDAVQWVLFFTTDTDAYASCDYIYKDVYVDVKTRLSIDNRDIKKIAEKWGSPEFVQREKLVVKNVTV